MASGAADLAVMPITITINSYQSALGMLIVDPVAFDCLSHLLGR
jgi:hypothetical protein